jgi:hypothetical protein
LVVEVIAVYGGPSGAGGWFVELPAHSAAIKAMDGERPIPIVFSPGFLQSPVSYPEPFSMERGLAVVR